MAREQIEIHLRYEGPDVDDGTMSVEDIVPVLQGFSSAYRKLVIRDDPESKHRLRLAAVRQGSADIILDVWRTASDLYRVLLGIERPARFHLAPLTGQPDGEAWRATALLALASGFTTEDIVQTGLGRSYSWSGRESAMWAGWRRSFEVLLADARHEIVRIGRRGVETTAKDERRALERERYQAVHGW